jgi:hypothetical protein
MTRRWKLTPLHGSLDAHHVAPEQMCNAFFGDNGVWMQYGKRRDDAREILCIRDAVSA